jgi:hypothetical protein
MNSRPVAKHSGTLAITRNQKEEEIAAVIIS